MAFIGLDGMSVRVRGQIKSTDTAITLEPNAADYVAALGSADHTWLILDDGVVTEVVQLNGSDKIYTGKDGVTITVQRGANGIKNNFGSNTILYYGFCTQIVRDTVAALVG